MLLRRDSTTAVLFALCLGAGCSSSPPENAKVMDGIIVTTDAIYGAIDADPDTWSTPLTDGGADIAGDVAAGNGGTVTVRGWRESTDVAASSGFHSAFNEKLFLDLNNYGVLDMALTGTVIVTTHSTDFAGASFMAAQCIYGGLNILDACIYIKRPEKFKSAVPFLLRFVCQLNARLNAPEQVGAKGDEAFARQIIGDIAHHLIDTEDFLNDDNARAFAAFG